MSDFDNLVLNRGEFFIQAVLENWEHSRQLKPTHFMTLEQRWARFIRETDSYVRAAA